MHGASRLHSLNAQTADHLNQHSRNFGGTRHEALDLHGAKADDASVFTRSLHIIVNIELMPLGAGHSAATVSSA
jgi:hypothetical protein